MKFLSHLAERIRRRDSTELLRIIIIISLSIIAILSFLFYSYNTSKHLLMQKYSHINKERTKIRTLLAQHDLLVKQQRMVDDLLAKEPNFKIRQFFTEIIADLSLQSAVAKEPETAAPQDLGRRYSELRLDANLKQITMQQLVALLKKIGEQERVYVKNLTITRSSSPAYIDCKISLATFEQNTASGV